MTITESFLLMLAIIESGNKDIPGDFRKGIPLAQGPFQIHACTVAEANRIAKLHGLPPGFYTLEDRRDYYMARAMAYDVLAYWKPILEKRFKMKWTEADALAFWRWGPGQWTPKSKDHKIDKERTEKYERLCRNHGRRG